MKIEGLDEDVTERGGWHKVRAFGRVVHARRTGDHMLLAMRVGNIPLGVPFRSVGGWGVIDVEVDRSPQAQ